jgi:glycosyltransferase involved in cell wall biosynthesis
VELRKLVKSLDLSGNVIFAGFISGHKKNEALVDSSIVAQMSREEAGAWAPFEAVLCETPIIVTDHTGSGLDVKKIDAGETVEIDDIDSLGEKLFQMLEDYDLVKAKTLKAKSYIEDNLSFNGRVHEYTDLYRASIDRDNNKRVSVNE